MRIPCGRQQAVQAAWKVCAVLAIAAAIVVPACRAQPSVKQMRARHHHHEPSSDEADDTSADASSSSSTTSPTSFAASDTSNTLIPVGKKDPGVFAGTRHGGISGWPFMPDITQLANATLDTTSITVGDAGATLTHYISSNYSASTVKRAVVMVHGDDRVSWNMQIYTNKALLRATSGGGVDYGDVVLVAPQFFETIDAGAYPTVAGSRDPSDKTMVWRRSWGDGSKSDYPARSDVGAFDALDALSTFFLDKTKFPALQNVVIGGFSMGGQLVQRYSMFRADTTNDDRMRYWVSSPASFVYLNESRPVPVPADCDNYNRYKYGLEGTLPAYVQSSDPVTLASRYISRTLNFFVGTSDYIAGDPRCQADAQGTSHLQKMYFWITTVLPYLGSAASGKLPSATTIDYIKGIGHDPWNIINSDAGVQRLFLDDYDGDGATAAAPKSNGITSVQPSQSDLHKHKNGALAALRAPDSLLLTIAALALSAALGSCLYD